MKTEISVVDLRAGVIYSHYQSKRLEGEQFISEHGLCFFFEGKLMVSDALETQTFSAGDTVFYRRNFLGKFVKLPGENDSFRAITVIFEQKSLNDFSHRYKVGYEKPYPVSHAVARLENSVLLEHYFRTLVPYFNLPIPEGFADLKRAEALMLLLQVNPELKNILFDFAPPGKIDLEGFMQQNFRFNISLQRFAYLTGRSLATFKRDFDKIFRMPPSRWLQQRRLEEAHYLIREQNRRPSDVYHEVGFESLAHFSYTFKQFFGINPSLLIK